MTSHGEDRERPTGGHLNAAIARGVVHTHSHYVGRGPTKAQAFFHSNVVVVIMRETMTKGELSLVADGKLDAVLQMRRQLQRTMQPALVSQVESLTGCEVVAFLSANHIDPDFEAELFILDRPVRGNRTSASLG